MQTLKLKINPYPQPGKPSHLNPIKLSEERVVLVKLGCVLVHDLLRGLKGIVMWQSGFDLLVCRLGLLVGMIVDKEVHDAASANGALVYRVAGGKFTVLSDANLLQQVHGEVLAVVVDEVVSWSLLLHVEDDHLAWSQLHE